MAELVEITMCKDCKCFFTYTKDDIADGNNVEGADGVCYMRIVNSNDNQFCAVKRDDFCSWGTPKERGKENALKDGAKERDEKI